MVSVYRPVWYGPPPTVEEHLDGPLEQLDSGHKLSWWLTRAAAGERPHLAIVHTTTKDDGWPSGLYSSAGDPFVESGEWCRLDPATGLPCAIGTPPEQKPTERERLLAALVQSERRCRAATKWTIESSRAHDERALAAMALLDHIIAEEDANAPG